MSAINWIVVLTRNNLALTQNAIESFRRQDISGGVNILVVDNESTDNTCAWLNSQPDLTCIFNRPQAGVAAGWNQALKWLFEPKWNTLSRPPRPMRPMAEYVLVCNNDVVLRPDTYRWLVRDGGGFVTAVGARDPERIKDLTPPDLSLKRPHPDFSCFLIRRETWEKVGKFDECFRGAYCEDSSYHLRMHRAGIRAEALELPFLHLGAQTVATAEPKERKRIQLQADENRRLFERMYGFRVGSEKYYAEFGHGTPDASVPSL